ncbi:MAG: lytic transglycosylase domain-containing protein [Lautropia sp.]|nr:lytic transglycosylase domain-containing protein [Lautropia sp.]
MRPLIQPGISQGVGRVTLGGVSLSATRGAWAGGQQYETLSDAVRVALSKAIAAPVSAEPLWASREQRIEWMTQMSDRLPRRHFPDFESRQRFLRTVRYEAQRAGLEPELVLGLIQVESAFRQYAISSVGARGYMQVMPFWTKVLGDGDAKRLFNPRINIRYGCVILRHYLDIEKGDLFLALGRYNGSRGRDPYPNAVFAAWDRWRFQPGSRSHSRTADAETAVPASVPRRASAATGMPQPKP